MRIWLGWMTYLSYLRHTQQLNSEKAPWDVLYKLARSPRLLHWRLYTCSSTQTVPESLQQKDLFKDANLRDHFNKAKNKLPSFREDKLELIQVIPVCRSQAGLSTFLTITFVELHTHTELSTSSRNNIRAVRSKICEQVNNSVIH